MTKNFNILFYVRKDKKNEQGMVPIYCRITVDGKRSEIAVKRYVQEGKWNSESGHVKGTTETAKSLNAYIDMIRGKIYEHQKELEANNKVTTALALKNAYYNIDHNKKSLFDVFEKHNAEVKSLINKGFALGTLKRYATVLKHLREFVLQQYNTSDFFIGDVDHEFIAEFDYFLRSKRHCENNSAIKYLKNFKKIIRLALANGWMTKDPFIGYGVKLKKVDRGFLTQEELNAIEAKRITVPRLACVRDAFLFQCYTGLAYVDIQKLTRKQIVKGADGEFWITTHRAKTDTSVNVPLLPQALAIIAKYKDHPQCLNNGKLLPVLTNQRMNSYLKEIGDICGISKNISSHLARHTFATTVTLANGVSLEAVSKMLGHTNLITSKIYARMMDSRVSEEMKALKGRMDAENKKIVNA